MFYLETFLVVLITWLAGFYLLKDLNYLLPSIILGTSAVWFYFSFASNGQPYSPVIAIASGILALIFGVTGNSLFYWNFLEPRPFSKDLKTMRQAYLVVGIGHVFFGGIAFLVGMGIARLAQ